MTRKPEWMSSSQWFSMPRGARARYREIDLKAASAVLRALYSDIPRIVNLIYKENAFLKALSRERST